MDSKSRFGEILDGAEEANWVPSPRPLAMPDQRLTRTMPSIAISADDAGRMAGRLWLGPQAQVE